MGDAARRERPGSYSMSNEPACKRASPFSAKSRRLQRLVNNEEPRLGESRFCLPPRAHFQPESPVFAKSLLHPPHSAHNLLVPGLGSGSVIAPINGDRARARRVWTDPIAVDVLGRGLRLAKDPQDWIAEKGSANGEVRHLRRPSHISRRSLLASTREGSRSFAGL